MIIRDTDSVIDLLRQFPPATVWLATLGSTELALGGWGGVSAGARAGKLFAIAIASAAPASAPMRARRYVPKPASPVSITPMSMPTSWPTSHSSTASAL